MNGLPKILLTEINYPLPEDRIAKYPLKNRDDSLLLIATGDRYQKDVFSHAGQYLAPESMLVFNNTRVIQARFLFHKTTGAAIEIFCLEPYTPSDYGLSLNATSTVIWKCMVGNAKKWKSGTLEMVTDFDSKKLLVKSTRLEDETVRFDWNQGIPFYKVLETCGSIPVPPYLNRKSEALDKTRYQTVYSKINGSVAAPTAGLHFTPQLIEKLGGEGHYFEELTLHVGAGTFKPVQHEIVTEHTMHPEFFVISLTMLKNLLNHKGHIIPVGTTSVRTLESLSYIAYLMKTGQFTPGQTHKVGQWDIYNIPQTTKQEALENIIDYMQKQQMESLHAVTSLMIVPGFRFLFTDRLFTNFHQPGSTLLLLVYALMGEKWKDMYQYALDHDFRFLSYGDSCLIIPQKSHV